MPLQFYFQRILSHTYQRTQQDQLQWLHKNMQSKIPSIKNGLPENSSCVFPG